MVAVSWLHLLLLRHSPPLLKLGFTIAQYTEYYITCIKGKMQLNYFLSEIWVCG